ncbi:hypothetical protein [Streptomyces sp. SP2-10]|uniref:hypothetical protein n=1 Tax=Streptomyces sp. SP2-10 TaxID=2873385 RepID=UPI001CA64AD0|nr:hypothetical protein [Streptomyces sp. SP2-10]MBY8846917.1 hypothetical protein [Streptomyces sp. SP2-10]
MAADTAPGALPGHPVQRHRHPQGHVAFIADLEQAGYLRRRRTGRRNEYVLALERPLRHPADAGLDVCGLVELAADDMSQPAKTASASVTVS